MTPDKSCTPEKGFTPTQMKILRLIRKHGSIYSMSGLAGLVFDQPHNKPRSPQGAALSIGRHVRPLIDAALVSTYNPEGPSLFRLTAAGKRAADRLNATER
ncbi:MarR family winged helix-turn-helix transcriptional regulator [Burkholderia vietnamiensis]|uniref:MarR family winged helix-turn-helix transcriptional regulator n=1 Tax=Burkholderia vietnamiensis TaxID=60552 RepID=UPI000A904D35|nr:MarR family winged helix-turn-helix transcriptional regulator [Burkholderia vietnamiensis]MBR8189139.1 winged helix-turn-helix transcriptional regulator [Burkholderia vietnamiensis]